MLHGAEDGVHNDDRKDNDGALQVAREDRYYCRGDQNDHQEVGKLSQKHLQNRFLFSLREHVLPVTAQQFICFLTRMSVGGDAELLQNVITRLLIPISHTKPPVSIGIAL